MIMVETDWMEGRRKEKCNGKIDCVKWNVFSYKLMTMQSLHIPIINGIHSSTHIPSSAIDANLVKTGICHEFGGQNRVPEVDSEVGDCKESELEGLVSDASTADAQSRSENCYYFIIIIS